MTQNRSTDKEAPMKTDRESVERLLDDVDRYSRPAYGEAFLSSPMRASKHRTIAATLRALLDENEALRGDLKTARRVADEHGNDAIMWKRRAEAAEAKLAHEDEAMDRDDLSPVERAVLAMWGERCPEHADGCSTCEAWAEIDRVRAAEARLEAVARAALERAVDCAVEADSYELATHGEGKIVARIRALEPAQIVKEVKDANSR